jgi:hypothetical protein
MKKLIVFLAVAIVAAAPATVRAQTHDHASMNMAPDRSPAAPAAVWLAQAQADYPLTTCVVSGDKLDGDMGAPFDYIYKEDGKPDRLVRFCCKGCVKDFKKDPAKYLKMIDDAAVAKSKVAPVAPQH